MNSVCLTFCLLLLSPFATKTFSQPPDPSQIPEPQIAYALHATWASDLTDNNPSVCTTSGTVAIPSFHFYAGWKDGAPAFFSVDWVLIEELTNEHQPQVWYFENLQGESGFPYGCTMPPVSDPQNWNWTTWSFAPMLGFAMHNTAYRVTVQWRYGVYMKGPRGPFQTSININVQNLVVTSPDETKVLKWDPVRGIADTTFSYSLECAQRKWCQVKVSIYSTDGMKVYEEWLEQIAPGSYSFTWDGSVNVVPPPPPPDGLAPAGLYVFDIEVIGIAPGYDEDWLRSRTVSIGDHYVLPISKNKVEAKYVLHSGRDAYDAWVEVWELTDLSRLAGPIHGPTHAIPHDTLPQEVDYNRVEVSLSTDASRIYVFLFWAQDNYPDINKSHRRKIGLINQQTKWKGWFLGIGFDYSPMGEEEVKNLIGGYFAKLNTSSLPSLAATIVQTINKGKDPKTQRFREEWGWTPQVPNLGYLIHTDWDYSPSKFVEEVNKLYTLWSQRRLREGIIYFTGHGGYHRLIGFAVGNPPTFPLRMETFGIPGNPQPTVPYTQLLSLLHVRLIYLSACLTCSDTNGTGLVATLANAVNTQGQKIGAKAVVGYHVSLKGIGGSPSERADPVFWGRLAGKTVEKDKKKPGYWNITNNSQGAGNVEEAANEAAKKLKPWWKPSQWVTWRDFMGIAGRNGQKDALATTLY